MSKKVSDEDDAGALDGTELTRIVKGGVSKRTTLATIAALAASSGGGTVVEGNSLTAVALPMPQDVTRLSTNPVMSLGTAGQFDAGSMRDADIFFARGKLWMVYTGALTATSPYNPTLGLAVSADGGTTWSKQGQIIPANTASGQWNSGGYFSPCCYYDPTTDELWVYVTGIQNPSDWYSGNMDIGVFKVAAGQAWNDPTKYTLMNSGAPIMTPSDSWEDIRVYAPTVQFLGGQYVMLYNSYLNSGPTWSVGRATAPAPDGPWTKDAANPLFAAAEEMSMVTLPGGTLIATCDDLSTVGGPYGIGIYSCSTQDGLGTWSKIGRVLTTGGQAFDAFAVGSSACALLPTGELVIAYNGLPTSHPTDARTIGIATGLIQLNVAPDVPAINALIADALSGGDSGDPHSAYVQFHMEPGPGPRVFDISRRGYRTGFNGTISNSSANPCFGTVAVRSTAGNGFVSVINTPEFNINATEDFTIEVWCSFHVAASALEMVFECDSNGVALYRTAAGNMEFAHSAILALITGTPTVGVGNWNLVVVQRTEGTLEMFSAVKGDATMTSIATAVTGNTTSFSSSNPLCLMAATHGTSGFMSGDIGGVRFSPGVSRGYTATTAVPTAAFPT